jgi:lysozyme
VAIRVRAVPAPAGFTAWSLWQYSNGQINAPASPVPGIGVCDRDRFNGSPDQLKAFWEGR